MSGASEYQPSTCGDYHAGHPWYYMLGGRILGPKKILQSVRMQEYRGYMAREIALIDSKGEPQRSASLRVMRAKILDEYHDDLSRYRELAHDLRRERKGAGPCADRSVCRNLHTNLSLKHNHLCNDLGHLIWLGELLTKQGDLFDF